MHYLASFASLPRPVQAMMMLGSGGGLLCLVMAFVPGQSVFWRWMAIGVVALIVLLLLYKLVLFLRDKAKSGPFSNMLSKAGARASGDPAQKARMDDLRKKFEEGVTTFKAAGKDLYSLPWYLLVGPSGSGKTEAMRHCNVGFPPGLQDCLQGSGGTLSMHWWFTNNAVVLDTAGRMFMEEAGDGGSTEWKEFLKLLKTARPNVPINGLLLVISSESLLKDSAEKIEQTAGAIARQLDVIQRTLDVRFPVFVIVTKCDKIVGFRDFFETINDPALQHQMLGWSNPAPLDEKFDPSQVDKHLDGVRHKLIRRRMGLLQNPVHTIDPNSRRTDQIDELFELPDNLVRIAPRLRRYLEMIFVAGEWSPKPLFLRGIYFTSSMREGQALDVSLASALGVDVESIPGGKEWDKEKAYFLRDVFLGKIFKERGLVTRATNVSKQLAKQRALMVGGSMAAALILAGVVVLGLFSFRGSLEKPSAFWTSVRTAYLGDPDTRKDPMDLRLTRDEAGGATYAGNEEFIDTEVLGEDLPTPAAVVAETARRANISIDPPVIAKPIGLFLGFGDGFINEQRMAHRAFFEETTVVPLVRASRSKLQTEEQWGPGAVGALAQLIRLQTLSHGSKPMIDGGGLLADLKDAKAGRIPNRKEPTAALDVNALFQYVLGDEAWKKLDKDRDKLEAAADAAYPKGYFEDNRPSEAFEGKEARSVNVVSDAADRLVTHLLALGAAPGTDMDKLVKLYTGLSKFRDEERRLASVQWLKAGGATGLGAPPKNLDEYTSFEEAVNERLRELEKSRKEIDAAVESLGASADDPMALLDRAGKQLQAEIASYFDDLLAQLPKGPESLGTGKQAEALAKAMAKNEPSELRELREKLTTRKTEVAAAVATSLEKMRGDVGAVAAMMTPGKADKAEARVYFLRWDAYRLAKDELEAATKPLPESAAGAPVSLAADIERVNAASTKAAEAITAWGTWTAFGPGLRLLSDDQRKAMDDDRNEAIRVAKRSVEVAAGRRQYELCVRAVREWPKDADLLAARVKAVADARIDAGEMKRHAMPKVPLSAMKDGAPFDAAFHLDAGKEVMGDWAAIRTRVEPAQSTGAPGMLGGEAIKNDRAYRLAADVTGEYARRYAGYWKNQALEVSRPNSDTWVAFGQELANTYPDDISSQLDRLRAITLEAYANIPATVLKADVLEKDKREVTEAFTGLDSPGFMGELRPALTTWKGLAGRDAGKAREELIQSYADGKAKSRYFELYRTGGRGVKYWNDLCTHGLALLVKETMGALGEARDLLIRVRGVPLAFGPGTMTDMSAAQVREAKGAAERLEGASGGGGAAAPAAGSAGLEAELEDTIRELSGASFIKRNPETEQWFRRLRSVLKVVGDAKPVATYVTVANEAPKPTRGGVGEDAREVYRYAALRVGGAAQGPVFNLNQAMPAADAKRVKADYPANGPTEIYLYIEPVTGANANVDKPDAKIVVPSTWGLLHEMLLDTGEAARTDAGTWRVLLTTGKGQYLWVELKFEPDLPVRTEWPTYEGWPTNAK